MELAANLGTLRIQFSALVILATILLPPLKSQGQLGEPCFVCNKTLGYTVFSAKDQVTDKKVWICDQCVKFDHSCFACGLPVKPGGLVLEDGRHYCPRDGDLAVVDARQMQLIVTETIDKLYYGLRDYMTFPTENLSVDMIDRINIDALLGQIGHDYACPDLRGYYQTITNQAGQRTHSIHILTGHTHGDTRAVLAHELTHAWITDNVPGERKLGRLAQEGFCELIAHLVSEKLGDTSAMEAIERNAYTRGQFALFKEAQQRYELRAILDWLHFGNESIIDSSDIDRVRRVTKPTKPGPKLWVRYSGSTTNKPAAAAPQPTTPNELLLKGILGNGTRRMAMISGKSFLVGEQGNVLLGETRTGIRCLEIGADFVRVELVDTGKIQTLTLKQP